MEPLADGQIWHMQETKMQVDLVGRLLVHYKLGKHNAIRIANSVSSKTSIEKFLKKNKAVLVKSAAPAVVKK
jgi:translation initiation factor IF-3